MRRIKLYLNIIAEGENAEVIVFRHVVEDCEHRILQLGDLLTFHRAAHLGFSKSDILYKEREAWSTQYIPPLDRVKHEGYETYVKDKDSVFGEGFQFWIVLSEVHKVSVNHLSKRVFRPALVIF